MKRDLDDPRLTAVMAGVIIMTSFCIRINKAVFFYKFYYVRESPIKNLFGHIYDAARALNLNENGV